MGITRNAFHRLVKAGAVHWHGIARRVSTHYESGRALIDVECAQNVDPVLKMNREDFNDPDYGWSKDRSTKHVARIPNIVINQWMQQGINIHDPAHTDKVLALLDSPEYSYLKVTPGRVSNRPARTFHTVTRAGVHGGPRR